MVEADAEEVVLAGEVVAVVQLQPAAGVQTPPDVAQDAGVLGLHGVAVAVGPVRQAGEVGRSGGGQRAAGQREVRPPVADAGQHARRRVERDRGVAGREGECVVRE